MTKSELAFFDTIYLGPILLLVNQYFGYRFPEYLLLWVSLVSTSAGLTDTFSTQCSCFKTRCPQALYFIFSSFLWMIHYAQNFYIRPCISKRGFVRPSVTRFPRIRENARFWSLFISEWMGKHPRSRLLHTLKHTHAPARTLAHPCDRWTTKVACSVLSSQRLMINDYKMGGSMTVPFYAKKLLKEMFWC